MLPRVMDVVAVTQSLSYLRPKRKPMYRPQGRKKVSTIRCFLLICKIPKSACRWGKFPHVIYFWSYFESMKAGIWKYESRYLRKGEIDYHTSVTLPKYSWVLCDLSKCSVCSSLTWMLQEVKVQLGESRIHHRGFCGTSQGCPHWVLCGVLLALNDSLTCRPKYKAHCTKC